MTDTEKVLAYALSELINAAINDPEVDELRLMGMLDIMKSVAGSIVVPIINEQFKATAGDGEVKH